MARSRQSTILERQILVRSKLWPEISSRDLWERENEGWVALPRLMPLMLSIMDDLSGKGFPVGKVYLELWSRLRDEQFLSLNRPEEMAFHAGFEGQRALRTWRNRIERLNKLGFISLKAGPLGDQSYALFLSPYHVIKRAYLEKRIQEKKWQALVMRASEINILDIDQIDDEGKLLAVEVSSDGPQPPLRKLSTSLRRKKRANVPES